jgi:hypothetical protein
LHGGVRGTVVINRSGNRCTNKNNHCDPDQQTTIHLSPKNANLKLSHSDEQTQKNV